MLVLSSIRLKGRIVIIISHLRPQANRCPDGNKFHAHGVPIPWAVSIRYRTQPPFSTVIPRPQAVGISCGLVAVRWIPPGDCRAALRLAMTVVFVGWYFWFGWAVVRASRRGHDPALRD